MQASRYVPVDPEHAFDVLLVAPLPTIFDRRYGAMPPVREVRGQDGAWGTVGQTRTVATTVLVLVGLYLVIVLEASSKMRGYTVGALCAALFALYLVVLSLPGWRDFFEVAAPDPAIILVSLVGTALAVTGLVLTDERFLPIPGRNPPGPPEPPSGSAPA